MVEQVNHPAHYGGADYIYEPIKIIDSWGLGFCLGNALKYMYRAGKKSVKEELLDLKKAAWYLNHHIEQMEKQCKS